VGVLQNGVLRKVGPTNELIEELTERRVSLYFKSDQLSQVQSPYLDSKEGNRLDFLIPQHLGIGELLTQIQTEQSDLVDIRITEGKLEEAFVRILGEGRKE